MTSAFALAAALAPAWLTGAHAGGFALREQSTPGLGMAFSGAASGSAALGSMYWNPATITGFAGIQSQLDVAGLLPSSTIKPGPGSSPLFVNTSSGQLVDPALLPSSYSSWQVNDSLWLGLATNTPYGLASKPDSSWTGRIYGSTTKVISFEATPTIGYRVNDWISVGAGLQVEYFKARYTGGVPSTFVPTSQWPTVGPDGDSWGIGYTLGATFRPYAGTTLGVGFRSAVEENLSGTFQGLPGAGAFLLPTRAVKVKLILPETLTVGLTQKVTDRFSLSAGLEWTNWSRFGFPRVIDQSTGRPYAASPILPLGYRDGWFYSVGGEYAINPQWTVRAGLAYEVSPIETSVRTPRLPDSNRIWTTLGASYRWNEKLTLDVAYAHIFAMNAPINIVPGNPSFRGLPLVGKADNHVDIISASLRYRWDDPARPISVGLPAARTD